VKGIFLKRGQKPPLSISSPSLVRKGDIRGWVVKYQSGVAK